MKKRIVIIGAGPAGIASAIQLKRFGIDSIVFEKNKIGGLIRNAKKIENYPPFHEYISGLEFADKLTTHLEKYFIKIIYREITLINYDETKKEYTLYTNDDKEYNADILIIASGTKAKKLSIPTDFYNKVYTEIEDLFDKIDKDIVIIGAGDAAFDYALNLSKKNSISILNRTENIKALPILRNLVLNSNNIKYEDNVLVRNVIQTNDKLQIEIKKNNEITYKKTDYLVLAIGRVPFKDFYSDNIKNLEKSLINEKSLYLIGDVKNDEYRQISISIGDGVKTAMEIYNNFFN